MIEILDVVRRLGVAAGGIVPAGGILLRVTVLLLVAALVVLALRRSSAALRHLLWTLSLVGTLLIPLCAWALPAWHWAILPQKPSAAAPALAPAPSSTPLPSTAPLPEDIRSMNAGPAGPVRPPFAAGAPLSGAAPAGQARNVPAAPPPIAAPVPVPIAGRAAWSWPTWLAAVWAAGTGLGLVWLGIGVAAAWHVARRARPLADSRWQGILHELLVDSHNRPSIEVRECPQVSVPMTWGLFRPMILVPSGSAGWSEEIQRSALLHELGHIRRGDCLMLLLGRLACAAYWFHPLAWLAVRQLRKLSEQAADDLVLASAIAPPDYAAHLVGIAAQMRGLRLFGHVALPMAGPSDLEGRVLAILDPRRNHRSPKRKTCFALVTLAVLLVIPCAVLKLGYAKAQEHASSTENVPKPSAGAAESGPAKAGTPTNEPSKVGSSNSTSAALDALIRQVRENEALYRNFDCTVHTIRQYEVSAAGATTSSAPTVSVSSSGSQLITMEETNRSVAVGDRLYFSGENETSPVPGEKLRGKRTWVFDGSQTVAIEDGNSATVYQGRYEPGQILPPHCWGIFHLGVNFPLSVYLQGTEAIRAYRKASRVAHEMGDISEFNKVESQVLGEETIDGLECVKVRVKQWDNTESPPGLVDLWLAKQRNFHVAQCRTSSSENGKEVLFDVTRVTKWREAAKGDWLPEVVEWQDLSAAERRANGLGKQKRRLVVEKAIVNPHLPEALFALPQIPASLPAFRIGNDGSLVDSPHHPRPAKAAEGTTLVSILKQLAEQENRYTPLEILATTQYAQLGGLSAGMSTQNAEHERSVVAGDRLYHEEERKTKQGDLTTSSNLSRQAYDGRWSRAYSEYLAPYAKPQTYASLDFESKNLRPIRPHTLLFHYVAINSQLLSAFLASGWSDKLNGYSMTVEYVGDELIDGLHCYKLKCSSSENGMLLGFSYVWLARNRNLLPLRRELYAPSVSETLPNGISFVEDVREIRPGQWLAFRATDLALQKDSLNGLNVNRLLLNWRKDVTIDRATLDPPVGDKLFSSVEVPEGTLVYVRDEYGASVGKFTQPQKGDLDLTLDKYRAMQREAEEKDEYDPKDATAPERKQRIDAAFKVLRSDPPAGQEARIEAAITILRNFRIFQTNTKKWAIAFRELIQIGKPAVPRLLRELDETDVANREHELRALGFVLRGIGDPRAVPALIRSLPYMLQPFNSDGGADLIDRELLKFMQEHDNANGSHEANYFSIGRPINEVLPALQKLTGIKQDVPGEQGEQEFKNIRLTFRDGSAEEVRTKQRLFLQFAQRWADWWSKNWKSYVKDEAEAQVEQTNRALERLSEVAPEPPPVTPPAGKDSTSNLAPAKAGTTGAAATGSAEPAKEPAEATIDVQEFRKAMSDEKLAIQSIGKQQPKPSLSSYEELADGVVRQWSERNKEHFAWLMLELCGPLSGWDFNKGTRENTGTRQYELARKYALLALENADSIPLDLELKLTFPVMPMLLYVVPKGQQFAECRRKDCEVQLHAWKRLLDAVDPNFNPNNPPGSSNDVSAEMGMPQGAPPEAVTEPLRSKYVAALALREKQNAKFNEQWQLQGWLKQRFPETAEAHVVRLYSEQPFDVDELKLLLGRYVSDAKTRARIVDTVSKNCAAKDGTNNLPPAKAGTAGAATTH